METLPHWRDLIGQAWIWRADPAPAVDPATLYPETVRFVDDVLALIETPGTFSPAG